LWRRVGHWLVVKLKATWGFVGAATHSRPIFFKPAFATARINLKLAAQVEVLALASHSSCEFIVKKCGRASNRAGAYQLAALPIPNTTALPPYLK